MLFRSVRFETLVVFTVLFVVYGLVAILYTLPHSKILLKLFHVLMAFAFIYTIFVIGSVLFSYIELPFELTFPAILILGLLQFLYSLIETVLVFRSSEETFHKKLIDSAIILTFSGVWLFCVFFILTIVSDINLFI